MLPNNSILAHRITGSASLTRRGGQDHCASRNLNAPISERQMFETVTSKLRRSGAGEQKITEMVSSFAPNKALFREGDDAAAAYQILTGVVRLYRTTSNGRRQITGFRFPGDIIGLEWDRAYWSTAESVRGVLAMRYGHSRVNCLQQIAF